MVRFFGNECIGVCGCFFEKEIVLGQDDTLESTIGADGEKCVLNAHWRF